jgi:hypothetical protein
MRAIVERMAGDDLELDCSKARFAEYTGDTLTIWGGDDEMPVELYIIDMPTVHSAGKEVVVYDLVKGKAARESEVTNDNWDHWGHRLTVFA